MRVLLWHVHGAWTTAFVHGPHEYLIPVAPDRGPDGLAAFTEALGARTAQEPAQIGPDLC